MHFAQGENIAFVLPSSGWAPSGAICQLSLSLLALFICLASQRAGGGAGNRLGPPDNGKSQGLLIPRGFFFWGGGGFGGDASDLRVPIPKHGGAAGMAPSMEVPSMGEMLHREQPGGVLGVFFRGGLLLFDPFSPPPQVAFGVPALHPVSLRLLLVLAFALCTGGATSRGGTVAGCWALRLIKA